MLDADQKHLLFTVSLTVVEAQGQSVMGHLELRRIGKPDRHLPDLANNRGTRHGGWRTVLVLSRQVDGLGQQHGLLNDLTGPRGQEPRQQARR